MRAIIVIFSLLLSHATQAQELPPATEPPPSLLAMIEKAAAQPKRKDLLIDVLLLAIDTAPAAAPTLVNRAIAVAPDQEIAILQAVNANKPDIAAITRLADGSSAAAKLAAHEAQPKPGFFSAKGWDGEIALGGSYLTGNTEEQAISLGVALDHARGAWEHHFDTTIDYSRNTGVTTKERLLSNYQVKWFFSERGYIFGQTDFELDKFSEFDWRLAEAGGLGYRVLQWSTGSWDLEGGPGSRQTKLAAGGTDIEFVGVLGSNLKWRINDKLRFSNDSSVFVGSKRTTFSNDAGLSISLASSWSGRLSFYVQHDTSVPLGQDKTDTATRLSVVYGF